LEKSGRFTLSFPAAESTAVKRRFVPYLFTIRFLPLPFFVAPPNLLNHHAHCKNLLMGHLRPLSCRLRRIPHSPPDPFTASSFPEPLLLKRATHHELLSLLCSARLDYLRSWYAEAPITPISPPGHKATYLIPLVDKFWKFYSDYTALGLDGLRFIARKGGSHAVAPDRLL
jgi:hypothetical protein